VSWFTKESPPPPPPPSKAPGWIQMLTPIIFSIIIGLAAFSFNGYRSHAEMRMDENKAKIEKLAEQKVDNQTMQLMIKLQEVQQKEIKEDVTEMKTQMDEILRLLQKTQK
jgi:hypothetical protein